MHYEMLSLAKSYQTLKNSYKHKSFAEEKVEDIPKLHIELSGNIILRKIVPTNLLKVFWPSVFNFNWQNYSKQVPIE